MCNTRSWYLCAIPKVQAIETLLASADTVIVESESRMALSSDLRRQLMRLVAASTVKQGGLRPGDPVGAIPPPPMPPPAFVLWIIDSTSSPSRAKSQDALAVIEVHIECGSPFAHAYQPGKKGAFLLESDGWRTLGTALEDERTRSTGRN